MRPLTAYRRDVSEYWDYATELYLPFTETFQGGLFAFGPRVCATENNRIVLGRAGIQTGMRLLDAGCGVCGPSRSIVSQMPEVVVDAVTISEVQAGIGRRLIKAEGLADHISVHLEDFHRTSFETERFDGAMFLESFGYTDAPNELCLELWRVLKPGGFVYVKDLFVDCEVSDETKQRELIEFQGRYRYRASCVCVTVRRFRSVGFMLERLVDVTDRIDRSVARSYMFEKGGRKLSRLGQLHFTGFDNLPMKFVELKLVKPTSCEPQGDDGELSVMRDLPDEACHGPAT
jgi:ubiquinone/menaquinone biosynthesis C-methylase UbiE